MKKLLTTILFYLINNAFAIDASFKMKICNFTLSYTYVRIYQVAGLTINNTKYTDFTSDVVYDQKIKYFKCQDLPLITAQGFNDVPAFMRFWFSGENPQSYNKFIEVFNLQNRTSMFNPETMITSLNIEARGEQTDTTVVYLHAKNNMQKNVIGYYSLLDTRNYYNSGVGYFQNLGVGYAYDFELYICDIRQKDPCENPDNYQILYLFS